MFHMVLVLRIAPGRRVESVTVNVDQTSNGLEAHNPLEEALIGYVLESESDALTRWQVLVIT